MAGRKLSLVPPVPAVTFSDVPAAEAPAPKTRAKKAAPAVESTPKTTVETVNASAVTPPAASPAVVTAKILRRFAADNAIAVGSRGKIPAAVETAFAGLKPAEQKKYLAV